LFITLPILNWLLNKAWSPMEAPNMVTWQSEKEEDDKDFFVNDSINQTPAIRIENSQIISLIIGFLGIAYIVYNFLTRGFDLDLNIVIVIFLFLGIIFHRTARRYLNSVQDGVKNVGGIMIQFLFYAGIMGMMVVSGLSAMIAQGFINISNEFTYPLFTF